MPTYTNPNLTPSHDYQGDIENSNRWFVAKSPNSFLVDAPDDNIIADRKNTNVTYKFNSNNFRSEEFVKEHNGKHILFAGCSNTLGEGIEYEKVWAYRMYQKIKENEELSGYFNLGVCGASIFEILVNLNRYIQKYSFPDVIVLLLPEIERDIRYFNSPKVSLTSIICELYNEFELLCKTNNTKLFATTWLNIDEEFLAKKYSTQEKLFQIKTVNSVYPEGNFYNNIAGVNPYEQIHQLEENSLTFKTLNEKDIAQDMYEYSLQNKGNENLFVAADVGKHHGEAFHYAWFKYFYERYKNEKNNLQN
jgi:hypothetical protein